MRIGNTTDENRKHFRSRTRHTTLPIHIQNPKKFLKNSDQDFFVKIYILNNLPRKHWRSLRFSCEAARNKLSTAGICWWTPTALWLPKFRFWCVHLSACFPYIYFLNSQKHPGLILVLFFIVAVNDEGNAGPVYSENTTETLMWTSFQGNSQFWRKECRHFSLQSNLYVIMFTSIAYSLP